MNGFGLRGFRSRRALAVLIGAIALPVGLWGCDGENTVELAPPEVLAPHIYAEVIDLRGRFREIYCQIKEDHGADFAHDFACHEALHLWPGEPAGTGQPVPTEEAGFQGPILVVPGIFGECIADHVKPFELALSHLNQAHGYETGIISVSGRSSSEHNANQIRLDLESRNLGGDRQAILIGYSKGTADILEALIRHPEIRTSFGHAGRARVEAEYDSARLGEQLIELYRNLLHSDGGAWGFDTPKGGGSDSAEPMRAGAVCKVKP